MPLLAELIDIPESVQRDDFVLKLVAGVSDEAAAKTLANHVVTPELAPKFDEALGFVRAALDNGVSKATLLHGSFGSGKSHFMAVLHRILQGDTAARGLPRLARVIPKHAGWMARRKFLLVPYYMIGKKDVTSAILGGYADFIREHHPEAPLPGVYRGESLLADARRLRSQMGDEAFFRNLAAQRGAGGWGDFDAGCDPASFAAAADAAPGAESRSRLLSDLVAAFFTAYGTQAEGKSEAFLELDRGLQVIAAHAKSLGYDAVVLFLDELVLWLAGQAANPEFVHGEVQKLVNLVESQEARREIPIVSFVARQRDLIDLLDAATPGAQQLRFSDAIFYRRDTVPAPPFSTAVNRLGHSPKVAAQHYLMSRDHHFEDVVNGAATVTPVTAAEGPTGAAACDVNCDAVATRNATPQASAPDRTRPHETTEPAATTRVTAGSSEVTPVAGTGRMAGAGCEQTPNPCGFSGIPSSDSANFSAGAGDALEVLARAVILVAGLAIPDHARAAILARVVAGVGLPEADSKTRNEPKAADLGAYELALAVEAVQGSIRATSGLSGTETATSAPAASSRTPGDLPGPSRFPRTLLDAGSVEQRVTLGRSPDAVRAGVTQILRRPPSGGASAAGALGAP